MIVVIKDNVANDSRWFSILDVLLEIVSYTTSTTSLDYAQYPRLSASAWLSAGSGRGPVAELVRLALKAHSLRPASDAILLTVDATAEVVPRATQPNSLLVHPLGVLQVILQPFQLIVEDETTDGAFVLWMARLLGVDQVRQAYNRGSLTFRHAGGKGQMVRAARAVSEGVWRRSRNGPLRERVGAMLDSDARFPGDSPNLQIAAELESLAAFTTVLARRAVENYLPSSFVRRRLTETHSAPKAEAYLRLPRPMTEHFHTKRGYRDAQGQPQTHQVFMADLGRDARERTQFADADAQDWDMLSGGFGDVLASVYVDEQYRCERATPHELDKEARAELQALLLTLVRHL